MSFDKVKELLANQLNISSDKIKVESRFVEDLNIDSLDMIEMLMALEDEFAMTIPNDKIDKIKTVGDLCKFIDSNNKK